MSVNMAAVLRRQFRSPMFFLTVFALVAAVVAINATAFGAIHALRWKALPYVDGERLVELQAHLRKPGFKMGLAERFREQIALDREHFAGVFGYPSAPAQALNDESGRAWKVARVGSDFEHVLGVAPALGRGFVADDADGDAASVLLLSDAVWRSRFDADPTVIGRELRLADRMYVVVGVMPRGFVFPDRGSDAWMPLVLSPSEREQAGQSYLGELNLVARLAAGVTVAQARDRLSALLAQDERSAAVRKSADIVAEVHPWRERFASSHWQALLLVQLAALILLVAVVANLVNLILDRLLGRAQELQIRRALGAGDGEIVRSVVADAAPPLLAGVALGLVATPLGLRALELRHLLPTDLPQGGGSGWVVIGIGVGIALIVLGCAVIAALASRASLRASNRAGLSGLGGLRTAMLIGQIMLTTALIGSVGLLLRSAVNLMASERGFDASGVLVTSVDAFDIAGDGHAPTPGAEYQRFVANLEALRADIVHLPGVRHAAIGDLPPFSGGDKSSKIRVTGLADDEQVRLRSVGADYFAALGIGQLAGRSFEATDAANAVIVDERYVQRYLANTDPLTATVGVPDSEGTFQPARIVGVVRTVKNQRLDEADALPMLYTYSAQPYPMFWLVTRADFAPAALAESVRQRVIAHFPDARIDANRPLHELVAQTLAERRSLLEAIGGFALLTLLLAALGLAAVLGFAIRRRTGELGLRMAIGATPARVRNLVMRQGGALIVLGAALGLLAGLPLARLLAQQLYGLPFTDPVTWLATVAVVAATAAFACWLPARRAAATDPIVALRHE